MVQYSRVQQAETATHSKYEGTAHSLGVNQTPV